MSARFSVVFADGAVMLGPLNLRGCHTWSSGRPTKAIWQHHNESHARNWKATGA